MKKFFIYFSTFVVICFLLPAVLTKAPKETSNLEIAKEVEEAESKDYEYQKYATISLLRTETQDIDELELDEYLYGVVSAEMPATYEIEALKAQAVVARTYTIYQIANGSKHTNADLCDSSLCCQAWLSKEDRMDRWEEDVRQSNWDKIVEAVDATSGKIVTYNGAPINAFFHSNSGGVTEVPVNVWGGTNYPYLQSVETAGESEYSQYSSEVEFTKEELISKLKESYPEVQIDFESGDAIQILEYTASGRVKTIKFGNIQISGVEARSTFGLKSANFEVLIDRR